MWHTLSFFRFGLMKIGAASLFFLSYSANSTNLVFDTAGNIIGTYVGTPSKPADWWYGSRDVTPAPGGGVNVKASGAVTVKGIRVPTSITAGISRAAIVAGAMGCVSGLTSIITCVATAAVVAQALKDAGLGYGPCPDGTSAFICKQRESFDMQSTGWTGRGISGVSASQAGQSVANYACNQYTKCYLDKSFTLKLAADGLSAEVITVDGSIGAITRGTKYVPGTKMTPATPDGDMGPDLDGEMGKKPDLGPKIWGAGRDDQGKMPRGDTKMAGDSTGVTVDAPPVSGPTVETSTETTSKPDGSTDTKKRLIKRL